MPQDRYISLVASLPNLGPMLAARFAPINRDRLEVRLRQLAPVHRNELRKASHILSWAQIAPGTTDEALVREARKVVPQLESETLQELVRGRLEIRTLLAALRRRHAGQDAPPEDQLWGYGRYVRKIRDNWREPGFGVEQSFPWVHEARAKLEAGEAAALERIALEAAWRATSRYTTAHTFDFEAVALYLLRWDLLDRWTRYDPDAAAARFETLTHEGLERAEAIFEEAGL